jgi:hypothetical protein
LQRTLLKKLFTVLYCSNNLLDVLDFASIVEEPPPTFISSAGVTVAAEDIQPL